MVLIRKPNVRDGRRPKNRMLVYRFVTNINIPYNPLEFKGLQYIFHCISFFCKMETIYFDKRDQCGFAASCMIAFHAERVMRNSEQIWFWISSCLAAISFRMDATYFSHSSMDAGA